MREGGRGGEDPLCRDHLPALGPAGGPRPGEDPPGESRCVLIPARSALAVTDSPLIIGRASLPKRKYRTDSSTAGSSIQLRRPVASRIM